MFSDGHTSANSEIAALLRSRGLTYPIATKADFVRLMMSVPQPVVFRGRRYDAGFGAGLVPEFFFPATSEQDLVAKLEELLFSRGLSPADGSGIAGHRTK